MGFVKLMPAKTEQRMDTPPPRAKFSHAMKTLQCLTRFKKALHLGLQRAKPRQNMNSAMEGATRLKPLWKLGKVLGGSIYRYVYRGAAPVSLWEKVHFPIVKMDQKKGIEGTKELQMSYSL